MITSPSKVRQLALEASKSRAHKFNRVSKEFIDAVEAATRAFVVRRVQAHPSKGMTLK